MRRFASLTIAGLGLAMSTLPAQAANTSQNNAREAQAASRARADGAEERRICVREQMGGSRITRSVCKTRAEWEALGILERDR